MLTVIMYHYVRDFSSTRFPMIKGMNVKDFRKQVALLREKFEVTTLNTAIDYLHGRYQATKDLCLLTFDDGLKEHYDQALPILEEFDVQGVFFIITSCVENRWIANVHKNHLLMAILTFEEYKKAFMEQLHYSAPDFDTTIPSHKAILTYRWDRRDVAEFKYLFNFMVDEETKDKILSPIFKDLLGDERAFADDFYLNWDETLDMQRRGMIIGGHTHKHTALSFLKEDDQRKDIITSFNLIKTHLSDQSLWPFSIPYGKPNTYNDTSIKLIKNSGFDCIFTTNVGGNNPKDDIFNIKRIDPKDI